MLERYGLWGVILLSFDKLRTLLFFRNARLIRFPLDIRNKSYIKLGLNFTAGRHCRFEAHPTPNQIGSCISIGDNVQFNDYVHVVGSIGVTIGNNVLFASKIFISDLNHGNYGFNGIHDNPIIPPIKRPISSRKVNIEDDVWIGEFVSVLPGVTIGKGSIIGSNSVVSKNIPPYCIAVGIPAKPTKKFNFETQCWEKIIYRE